MLGVNGKVWMMFKNGQRGQCQGWLLRLSSRLERVSAITRVILHSHLIPSCPHADLCGAKGRTWLNEQFVPEDERLAIDRHLREFDRLGEDLQVVEPDLARSPLEDDGVKRLMTIPGSK